MLLRTDSCAIDCTRGLLAEAARMPRIATGIFYFLVHVFVRYGRYFCLCPRRFRTHVYVGTFVGHVSPDALVRRPRVSAPDVLIKLVTTKQPYNILSCHIPPASPWAARGHRGGKMTKNGACCHHGMLEDTAVTKWPKMVHVVTMGC